MITFTLGPGGALRKLSDDATLEAVSAETIIEVHNALNQSLVKNSRDFIDSKNLCSNKEGQNYQNEVKNNFPLLPNPVSSRFWNQLWVKEYLSQIFKFLGYGPGGNKYGEGAATPGFNEEQIKWQDYQGHLLQLQSFLEIMLNSIFHKFKIF